MLGWLDELPAAKAVRLRVVAIPRAMAHEKIFCGFIFAELGAGSGRR
jgi:hypothetical protein